MHLVQTMAYAGATPWHGLATTAQFTSVRVVCSNTLQIALGCSSGAIKVPHRSQFEPDAVKRQLGITVSTWDSFVERMKVLCERPVDPDTVDGLLRRVLTYPGQGASAEIVNEQALASVRALNKGGGRGALLPSSRGTAWGVLNSVTEYVDHHRRARSGDHRRDAAWFLADNEWVIAQWAPINLHYLLKAWFWKESAMDVKALDVWQKSCSYLYLPRLWNSEVLAHAIAAGAASRDFFGLASGKEGDR